MKRCPPLNRVAIRESGYIIRNRNTFLGNWGPHSEKRIPISGDPWRPISGDFGLKFKNLKIWSVPVRALSPSLSFSLYMALCISISLTILSLFLNNVFSLAAFVGVAQCIFEFHYASYRRKPLWYSHTWMIYIIRLWYLPSDRNYIMYMFVPIYVRLSIVCVCFCFFLH